MKARLCTAVIRLYYHRLPTDIGYFLGRSLKLADEASLPVKLIFWGGWDARHTWETSQCQAYGIDIKSSHRLPTFLING